MPTFKELADQAIRDKVRGLKVKNFIANNKKKIIGGVVLIGIGVAAIAAYKHYVKVPDTVESIEDLALLDVDNLQ